MPQITPRQTAQPVAPRTTPSTVSDLARKQQTGDLITHLGKPDPHLHQALSSMQTQSNDIVQNVEDIVQAIQAFAKIVEDAILKATGKKVQVVPPSVPGGGGIRGFVSKSAGANGNTKPIPTRSA